jgi:hypothetical protein
MTFNRTTLLAGVGAGVGSALWTLFEFAMGWHGPKIEVGALTGFVGTVFPLVAIVWALRETKAELGALSMRQALMVGLSVAMVLAAIGVVFFHLYYTRINPEFLVRVQTPGATITATSQLVSVVVGSIGFSLLVALIGGWIMRSPATK